MDDRVGRTAVRSSAPRRSPRPFGGVPVSAGVAGFSVSLAGNVKGHGFDDIIVGAPGGTNAGEGYVVFGKSSGFGTIELTGLSATDGFIIQGDEGGSGFDTLALDGAGLLLDFTSISSSSKVADVEAFDLGASGVNTLRLNAQHLLQLSDQTNDLRVFGDGGGDSVDLVGAFAATGQETIEGVTFDVYTLTGTESGESGERITR